MIQKEHAITKKPPKNTTAKLDKNKPDRYTDRKATVYKFMQKKVKIFRERQVPFRPFTLIVGVVIIGTVLVAFSRAAGSAVFSEAEDGTVAAPAQILAQSGASGGQVLQFGTVTPPPPPPPTPPPSPGNTYSLRFYGNGVNDIDRIKIPLTTNKTVDVGGDFTIEWWMKTASGNNSGTCGTGEASWITGNIIFDRDVFGGGDYGDYGISLYGSSGILNFGVTRGSTGDSLCASISVADGLWHHVAATRNSTSGQLCFYIDGTQRGCHSGPTGDVSYRDGRSTGYPNSDPYLVFGAEKHDAGGSFPSYHGWLDEVRISNSVRYTANFTKPTDAFSADANTVALYHFDEGSGTVATDTTGNNNGTLRVGGSPTGPIYTTDLPF